MINQRIKHITANGLTFIKQFEGFSPVVYLDSAGLPTIGYGHLISPHERASFKNGITEAKAESLLRKDVQIAEEAVTRLIKAPITNNQFDALVSFTFNLGSGALQRSTLRRKVNMEEHDAVPPEFLRWAYVNGIKISGLLRRRMMEGKLYSSF